MSNRSIPSTLSAVRGRALRCLAAACALALFTACGGSDDDTPAAPPAATQTAIGTISGFGSVIVNGVRFDDAAARITVDDAVVARDRLRVGMQVQVRGRIHADGTGVADSIDVRDCIQGPITAMNRVRNTVTVMGQTVDIDDGTVFDGVTLRDMNAFAVGDQVEIGCQADPANNRLRATRMERLGSFQNGSSELEATGIVANLNLAASTCTVGSVVVNFAGVGAADRPNGLANGMTIEVSGRRYANGIFEADRLRDRDRDRINLPDGDGLELEGYVSDFASIASFKIDGRPVNAASAVIRNGTASDVRNGLKVEAEGTMSNGVLVASVLVIRLQADVRVEAGLQARDTAQSTITLLGRAIGITTDTELRDRLGAGNRPVAITLAALNPGDRLEVQARRDATGKIVATRVERTDADALVVVKAPVDATLPTTRVTLAGFEVATGALTRYRDASGELIDASTFYGALLVPPAVPSIVHARGVVAGLAVNTVDATRTTSTIGELEIAVGD